MSLFICPKCRAPLERSGGALVCRKGHSYDIAAQGYVNLCLSGRNKSAAPGDNAQMIAARTRFLESGAYAPLAGAIAGALRGRRILDAGCGEGDYARRLYALLAGREPEIYGVDLSRGGVKHAARVCGCKEVRFAVASVFTLPLQDGAFDAVYNVFSPLAPAETARVLRPGGRFYAAYPGARHLFEMKQVLYERPYENDESGHEVEGLRLLSAERVRYPMALESAQLIESLYTMTPYYYKTPPEGARRLRALGRLDVTADFLLCEYARD